jgi:hypothetical protein
MCINLERGHHGRGLLTDRDEISNLYRGPSIGASYQVLVQLAIKQFQGRRFFEIDQSIKFPQSRMKGERYRPTEPLVIELECMCINLERGHHGRDHMQSVHIVWEEDFSKSTNLKQELLVAAMFANESG